ncbi:DinB family protein [Blastococcus atacamensis]|uniref:DinB family protein n=1 Tax=Blastococcus atacamensis TaxID=2070508 RepID=UPI000CEC52FC|nr:DinB family protein [Blastococcus atacamensis]
MTIPARVRPPGDGDERTQVLGWLNLQRSVVHQKCEGLDDAAAHRPLVPTSPLMTVAGLVSHLRWVEHCWFQVLFLDRGTEDNPQFGGVPDADFQVDGIPLAQLLEEYARQCADSDAVVAAASLDDRGRNREHGTDQLSLRWILGHMVEEVARHVGHLDLLREMTDGERGYY